MILSFITNNLIEANHVQTAGIDRIMIDLETKGKNIRQSGKNLFLSDHTINDVLLMKKHFKKMPLFVRVNPINNDSEKEITTVIQMGADIIMLPFFHSIDEIKTFIKLTKGAVTNSLLVEIKEAANLLPKIVDLKEVQEIHIGFNDLSISFGYSTIFEPILNGSLEEYSEIINKQKIPWGFGGMAKLFDQTLPIDPKLILFEQLRLKTSIGWLGRSFRGLLNTNMNSSIKEEVLLIRKFLADYTKYPSLFFDVKHEELLMQIRSIKESSE